MPESSRGENGHLVRRIFGCCAYFGAFDGGRAAAAALALREHGCDFVHGYCFARADEIVTGCECSGCLKQFGEQDGLKAQAETQGRCRFPPKSHGHDA